jgi:hypothetical protein
MPKFIVLLALASVLAIPVVAGAQERTGSSSVDLHPHARPPKTPEEVMSKLSTPQRAQKLREADLETRKLFGVYQSVVAEARHDGDPTDAAADAVLGIQAQSATRQQISGFGEDTDERAQQLRNVGKATRRAFDKFQAAYWREQDLADAAGAEARIAAFGEDTAKPDTGSEQPQGADAVTQQNPESGDQNH